MLRSGGWPFDRSPLLVFWETTKACLLACKHCRARAIREPLPGELSTEEAFNLIDQVASFNPKPILVFTGGDPLMRRDIWDLISYARSRGLRVGLAPSTTPLLTEEVADRAAEAGVNAVSISIDSGVPEVHDSIRGVEGSWRHAVQAVKWFMERGVRVQVNTLISKETIPTLPETVKLLVELEVPTMEAFYLVPVGRAGEEMMPTPEEFEAVSHFLYEATRYGLTIRTTEGPMYRRVALERGLLRSAGHDPDEVLEPPRLYWELYSKLRSLLGEASGEPRAATTGTRDGKGIIFVAYNGDVRPSGFMEYSLGNVREEPLPRIYREHPLLRRIRAADFNGPCGLCEFRDICGGSRARAYHVTGDPLGSDPACPYEPGSFTELASRLGVDVSQAPLLPPKRGKAN